MGLLHDRRQRAARAGWASPTVIIDQHFRQRDRLGRLLTALATTRSRSVSGSMRDTGAFIGPDETVRGSRGAGRDHRRWVGRQLFVRRHGRGRTAGLHAGLRLHVLVAGATSTAHHIATAGALTQVQGRDARSRSRAASCLEQYRFS